MNRKVTFKETVELFLNHTIYEITNEKETPRINFIFNNDAYDLFNKIMKYPFKLKKGWTPDIKKEDIELLKTMNNYDYPTIFVKDHIKFFTYLTEITNNLIIQFNNYKIDKISRRLLIQLMRRIWLRMSPNDFNNVEEFLKRQLEFVKTDIFEKYKFISFNKKNIIGTFYNYNISVENYMNQLWFESSKHISFEILTEDITHTLPDIHYDILEDICYIYAIQNNLKDNKNKEINKLIYKKYKGNNQPNKVYVLKLFIELLKQHNIKYIRIPTLQVLNYRYHELLGIETKKDFEEIWNKKRLNNLKQLKGKELEYELSSYENDLKYYKNIVNQEDKISKLKTEDLIHLIYRIINEDNELELLNDIDISDTLDIKIKTLTR